MCFLFCYLSVTCCSLHPSLTFNRLFPYLEKLTQVVPNVHLSAQSAHFNNGLTQEVITLTFEPLFHTRLDVVILVPHTNLDAVR